ncbi:MBL fold metallo-hydrolase [Solirubrobacter sp. CPCC 204708]|uniref:MBL fold metallo-hydrolase n=1 Tax=Solirubrobacter deserti TaxID=2282478 RepID=A0ABT4RGQ7_9ACTN|nr:MBL fold metallo-hydrolase [Solirubrobacter deserti]MBE2315434.1 MBL fold metallo-hydrolase [Solirubrobacter deserti]MDA0137724.1 MBL fold metallo-hydrolase [Solirubrobacter deserti]
MIHQLPIPTPFRVGDVNAYLIEDDPLTLVDVGPGSARSLAALEAGLARLGRRVQELERIVITHQHADHLGLVDVLAERSGAAVCALDALVPILEDFEGYAERNDTFAQALLRRHGVPDEVVITLGAVTRGYRAWGASAPVGEVLRDGGQLGFAGRAFTVHHRPGHSPTDTTFLDPASGDLLAGDHLLRHISSNPLIALPPTAGPEAERPHTLATYMGSLRQTREQPVGTVFPGHGATFTGHATLIEERFAMHERRARKFAALIAQAPRTAHEIAFETWGKPAFTQALLTLSEVLGHVDLLIERGDVIETEHAGVVRFTTT